MSVRKYGSIHTLKEAVSLLTDKGGIDQALHLIHDFVECIVTEPLCTSQVFGSKTLDDLCQRIGNASLAEIKQEIADAAPSQRDPPVFVYIVTKLQKSGGHTRVIEDFIKAQPEGQHVILSTELGGRSDTGYLMQGLAKPVDIIFEQAPKASYQQRLTWLQKRLLKIRPKRVYLFNHHQDSVAVCARFIDGAIDQRQVVAVRRIVGPLAIARRFARRGRATRKAPQSLRFRPTLPDRDIVAHDDAVPGKGAIIHQPSDSRS